MMRFRIFCVSVLLTVFLIQSSYAQTPLEGEDALLPMDFDEAAQMLESSTRESYELWVGQLTALLREYEVPLSELMVEVQENSELQARFYQMEESSYEIAQRTSIAIESMLDPLNRDRLADYLESATTLPLLSLLTHAGGYEMYRDSSDGTESARTSVSDLVSSSRQLQDRLVALIFDERSVLTLAFPEGNRQSIAAMFDDQYSSNWGFRVGQQAVYPAMQLLPKATLTRTLEQATRPSRVDRLPDYLEELIEAGTLTMMQELPFDWLVEQVEAGSLIWLNTLALADDGGDHPLLFEHFDQLDRPQQLRLISISPRSEFLPVLRDAWRDAMDAAWCDGCAESVDKGLVKELLEVLTNWQTDESAEMLAELMAMESYAEIVEPMRTTIGMAALHSESDAFVRLGMAMSRADVDMPISYWSLQNLHRVDASELLDVIRVRFDQWSEKAESDQRLYSMDGFRCQRAALGFYAEGQGLSVDWRQWMPAETEASGQMHDAGCLSALTMAALADPETTAPLMALLTEMEATDASADRYDNLIYLAQRQAKPSREQRDLLTAVLIDHPLWDSLSEPRRDWLLGIETPRRSQLSCESDEGLTDPTDD